MTLFILKTAIAAGIISFCSWLSGKRPDLAGFIIALPVATLIALAFSYAEYENPQISIAFAKSIFAGIPVSLLFFVPFLLAERLGLSFWQCYLAGLGLLAVGFFLHKSIVTFL